MKQSISLRVSIMVIRVFQIIIVLSIFNHLRNGTQEILRGESEHYLIDSSFNLDLSSTYKFDLSKKQSSFSFYINWTQALLGMVLYLYICQVLTQVLRSVQSYKTFLGGNVQRFRKMGLAALILFLINLFDFHYLIDEASPLKIEWSISFSYLILMLGAFIMAEIFKEGLRLAEEQKLIV